jgi:glycosyltransferase involved in cell wall biosynthesis
MAVELSKDYPVLYVNRALDRASAVKFAKDAKIIQRKKVAASGAIDVQKVGEQIYVFTPSCMLESINSIPAGLSFVFDFLNKINNKRLAKDIEKAMKHLGFTNAMLLIDNDFFRGQYLSEMLPVKRTGYYIRDYLNAQPYFAKHGVRLEKNLIGKVDFVAANSAYLASYAKQWNKRSVDIGQGCELDAFNLQEQELPDELTTIRKPIIGYTGALIQSRLDIDLLIAIAKNVDASLVLVGPEDEAFKQSSLHAMPNVFFTGTKDAGILPKYIAAFDVCINPQVLNQLTIGNYPRKIDEYLAMGKSVVATKTEAMVMFEPFVSVAASHHEFIAAINKNLQQLPSEELILARRNFALGHSWEQSIKKLETQIRSLSHS